MKKLTILLALCLIVTSFVACAKKPLDMAGNETPDQSTEDKNEDNSQTDTDTEDGFDKFPELELDDTPAPVAKGMTGRVTESSLNVRETAGKKGKSVGTVERGNELLISELVGVDSVLWGYMGEGYVCLDYVSFDMDRNGTMICGTVTADNLSAREAPHLFCDVIEKIPNGTRLEISALACSGTAIWGLTSSGWVCLNYVELDQGVTVVEGENAETLDPFYLAPDYKEVIPKSAQSVAATAESVLGTWEFVTLTGFYSTIYEEFFDAIQGSVTFNEDGSFVCNYAYYRSTLYSTETNVSSWTEQAAGLPIVGGTYEVTENAIVLNYTYSENMNADEYEEMSKTVTLQVSQDGDMLFVKNPKDIIYVNEKDCAKITHPVFYRNVSDSLLEKVYPGTYY